MSWVQLNLVKSRLSGCPVVPFDYRVPLNQVNFNDKNFPARNQAPQLMKRRY